MACSSRRAANLPLISASIATVFLLLSSFASAQKITVAAASDLQFALPEIAANFEKASGHRVELIFGSSGNFFAQIQNGASYDVFFSADIDYPKKLEAAGLTEPGSLQLYARGKIVLWAPAASKLDLSRGLPVLLDPAVKKVAIANPQHAPYGRAAVAALRSEKVYDQVAGKLVLGENISQTASFVVSGGADVGILALSLALAPALKDKGKYQEIPESDCPPLNQAAAILKSSMQKDLARQFVSYLKTSASLSLLKRYGFMPPNSSP